MTHIQYLGHSCFLFELGGKQVIVDPFINDNPLNVGDIQIDQLKPDYILLTHGHNDHVADAESLSIQNGAPIISNYEVAGWFQEKGCMAIGMNIGGAHDFGFGTVRMVNAVHTSSMPDGSYGGNPAGFLINHSGGILYIAGDTALTKDMELIPAYYGKPDLAILPVGGFFTMDYKDAAIAAEMIGCETIIGCHFNTFAPIHLIPNEAINHFHSLGKRLILPRLNDIIDYK